MKKNLGLLLVIFLLALLQSGFLSFLKIQPNLLLVFLAAIFMYEKNSGSKLLSVFWAGFLLDIFSGLAVGSAVLSFLLMYMLINIFLKYVREMNFLLFFAIIAMASLSFELILPTSSWLISRIFNYSDFLRIDAYSMVIKTIYNLIFGAIIFYLLKFLNNRLAA